MLLRAAKQSLERGEAFFPERIWYSDSSKAKTLMERRALVQVGRPWLFQEQERRKNQWSLPWPTDVTQLYKNNNKIKREKVEKLHDTKQG